MGQRLHPDAGGVGRNQQEGKIAIALVRRAGADQRVDDIGPVGARAPALGAVHHHRVAVAFRPGGDAREITPDIGLGQAISEEHVPPGQPWEIGRLLRFGAIFAEVHAAIESGVDIGPGKKGPGHRQFLDHGDRRHQVAPRAAMLFGHGQRREPKFPELRIDVARPAPFLIPPLARRGWGFGFHKAAHLGADFRHMGRIVERQRRAGHVLCRPIRRKAGACAFRAWRRLPRRGRRPGSTAFHAPATSPSSAQPAPSAAGW